MNRRVSLEKINQNCNVIYISLTNCAICYENLYYANFVFDGLRSL